MDRERSYGMTAAGGSHIGLRKNNEDSYYIDENGRCLVIADGMGGHVYGQLASQIAVKQFAEFVEGICHTEFSIEMMRTLFAQANQAVHKKQETLNDGIMGTTLTAIYIDDNQLYVGHVGDSRLYLLRDDELMQLSMDHSYYAELLRHGNTEIPLENQQKHVLLKALGPEEVMDGQFLQMELYVGDMLLLCTDGLSNVLNEVTLKETMRQPILEDSVHQLIQLALRNGASDNITVIVYRYD